MRPRLRKACPRWPSRRAPPTGPQTAPKLALASAQTAFPLVPDLPEWLSPLLTVVPGQVAAVELAKLRGADVDSPKGLTKITRTR